MKTTIEFNLEKFPYEDFKDFYKERNELDNLDVSIYPNHDFFIGIIVFTVKVRFNDIAASKREKQLYKAIVKTLKPLDFDNGLK
jgi:hypothetical protein